MGRLYKRGKVWWADYIDRDGNRIRKSTKLPLKELASKVLATWEHHERMVETGAAVESRAGDTLESILKLFESDKIAAGKSQDYVDKTGTQIRELAKFNSWKLLGDIDSEGITEYSKHLLEQGMSARTRASVITAVRGFCRWCAAKDYLTGDPTASVKKPSTKDDRRLERRMILPDEWRWIRNYLELVKESRNGQSANERLLMYRLAIESGLRSGEIRSLKCSSLHLKGTEHFVTVKASITKNAKQAKQFISTSLAADLGKFIARRSANAAVFAVKDRLEMASTLRADVEGARSLWLATVKDEHEKESDFLRSPNSQGEVIDFHALRHTCGAWLVMQGVTLAEVQQIMRHSTITLTIDTYGHLAPDAKSQRREILGGML